jgi:ArsR family transcriptional regulator
MIYEKLGRTDIERQADILKTLGHPARLCIMLKLTKGAKNVSEMQGCLNIPQSTVSQHLATMRAKGLIKGERKGTEVIYSISDPSIKYIVEAIIKCWEEENNG